MAAVRGCWGGEYLGMGFLIREATAPLGYPSSRDWCRCHGESGAPLEMAPQVKFPRKYDSP